MLTPEQALPALLSLLGSGGLATITVAILNYRTAARAGRKPPDTPISIVAPAINAAMQDRESAHHLGTIAYALVRIAATYELRAELEMKDLPGFHDRLDNKVDRLVIEAIRTWMKVPAE